MSISNWLAMIALLPWGMFFIWCVSVFFSQTKSRVRALIDAVVMQTACSVFIAELTSLFTAYNWLWVGLCWTTSCLLLLAIHQKYLHTLVPGKDFFQKLPSLSRHEKLLLYLMIGSIAFVIFKIFLSPPNAPTDSIQYHQPRAFMYYKNQSIHAYATSYGHMLYFGPLNAIIMSQWQILCGGWDRLYPFVQFTAYLFTMLAIYQMTLLFCKTRRFAFIGAALVCFMPMTHLQASTTQSDLLVTCFCVISVYYMIQIWTDFDLGKKPNQRQFAMLGLSCGLAVLSKLSAGVTLICFALAFAALLWIKLRSSAFTRLLIIVLCVVIVTCGFWIRNAMDWSGDFLPISYSGSRPDYNELGVKGTLLISAKALATTISSPHEDLPHFLALPSYWVARAAAAVLQMDLDNPITTEGSPFTGTVHFMPDDISYPFHAILVLSASLFCIILSLRRKKWWLLAYTICCVSSILIASTQYLWCTSFNRYLCPSIVLSFPLAAYMLQRLCQKYLGWKRFCVLWLTLMFAFNALCSIVHPAKDIIESHIYGLSYGERLIRGMDPSAYPYWRQVTADITENNCRKIAFDSQAINGDYFWMRAFTSPDFEVRYINALVRPDLETPDFVPDCILGSYQRDSVPETIDYHGVHYIQKFPVTSVLWPQEISPRFTAYYVKAEQ